MSEMLSYALKYAKYGWLVFPVHHIVNGKCSCGSDCGSPGKHPRVHNGLLEASKNEAAIREWWGKWPDANIGVRTGKESGIWVIDADLPDGPNNIKKLDLPKTMAQMTGSGGLHYIFKWDNEYDIRNSAKKIAPCVDVRGFNGYVLLPPSNHISGGNYKWLSKVTPAEAPKALLELATQKDSNPIQNQSTTPYGQSAYGMKALGEEITKLVTSANGNRNTTLNECSFNLSQLVAGGELEESTVKAALLSSAIAVGLKEVEARKTIDSGFRAGSSKPRSSESNQSNRSNQNNPSNEKLPEVTESNRKVTGSNRKVTEVTGETDRFNGNLRGEIRNFLKEYQGSFTVADIDREFGIVHPADKNARKQALLVLVKEKYIKRDIRIVGKYHILKQDVSFIDFDSVETSPFAIDLPLGLSDMVRIPKKSIIVLAGSTNAGKTAIAIDVIRRNLDKPYDIMYLMSEMGPSEYKQRIQNAIPDVSRWKAKVKAADVPGGFDGVIAQNNPNGLTVIDFLEEFNGEYYRIASDLRAIYDSLEEGVALVCLQKHSKADVGRGGESTAEKPRLYLSLDKLVNDKHSTISAVKIYKAKDYEGDNPNGKERHIVFRRRGSEIEPITDWIYCNAVQRQKYIDHYEQKISRGEAVFGEEDTTGFCFYFETKGGKTVRIAERDIDKWRAAFPNINVDAELIRISNASKNDRFIEDKSYFFQISGILKKKNAEVCK